MTKNEIVGRLKDGGIVASSTNRNAAVYVTDARIGRAEAGWFSIMAPKLESALLTPPAMDTITSIGDLWTLGMYSDCISITSAADMPVLTTIGDSGCSCMYSGCTFDMSDNGTTLNFAFPTPPLTAGETTYATAYDVAEWMGNTNGF